MPCLQPEVVEEHQVRPAATPAGIAAAAHALAQLAQHGGVAEVRGLHVVGLQHVRQFREKAGGGAAMVVPRRRRS